MYASLAASLLLLAASGELPSRSASPAPAPAAAAAPALPLPAPAADPLPASPAAVFAVSPAAPLAAPPELRLPRGGLEPTALAAPALLVAGLGAAAYLLRRRRRPAGRRVEVLETTSLGPKRSLVLARFEDELLLLGTSEAGVQLLHHRPGAIAPGVEAGEAADAPAPPAHAVAEPPGSLAGLVTRLRRARPALRQAQGDRTDGSMQFDALLTESVEDQELRRKLARGQGGSVR